MLERILHTLEAKGEGGESKEKSREKSREKTPDRILRLLHEKPTMTQQELAEALELSVQAVEKNIAKLKAEHRLRRIGPDKGGHWEA